MIETYLNEPNIPATFIESVDKSGSGNYRILGKLQAPFFDLNAPTRNGRDYSEAAETALMSDEFKEKMETRTFFGRLGHPMTEDECAEDPAVRACVIMTDYKKNPSTNMYEGTLEILDNHYGRQLKSLVDAGCIMGVSTRGSGESRESMNGSEVITKGTYEFEGLDVVTLPAVKAARCTVLESFDKSKRKSIESLIETSNDKYVLESLKMTLEASNMPNKKVLIESIETKLSNGVETIESFANEILMLTQKLNEAESKLKDKDKELESLTEQLQELKSKSGTTGSDDKNVSESANKNLAIMLKSSARVLESIKVELRKKDEELTESKNALSTANGTISKLQESLTEMSKVNDELSKHNESLESQFNEYKDSSTKQLIESKVSSGNTVKTLQESLNASKLQVTNLSKMNESLNAQVTNVTEKYIESLAIAMGISITDLKSKVGNNKSITFIESAAKSLRDSEDARKLALPSPINLGTKVVESVSHPTMDDPELGRAARIASLVNQNRN